MSFSIVCFRGARIEARGIELEIPSDRILQLGQPETTSLQMHQEEPEEWRLNFQANGDEGVIIWAVDYTLDLSGPELCDVTPTCVPKGVTIIDNPQFGIEHEE